MALEGFDLFKKPDRRRSTATAPSVSITKTGQITFNRLSVELFKNPPEFVYLLYNKKKNQVALQAASIDDEGAYKVRYIKSGQGIVSARTFLQAYGISHEEVRQFAPEQLADDVIMFSLN